MNKHYLNSISLLVESIKGFKTRHGIQALQEAIHYGAFHSTPLSSEFNIMDFIHPSKEIKEIVPEWILELYYNLV